MGLVYIAALIIGLGTLAMQVLLAHAGGGEHGVEHEVPDAAEADHPDMDGEHGSSVWSGLSTFLSFRFWLYALLAFGMVGTPTHYLKLSGEYVCFAVALGMGLTAGLAVSWLFRSLKQGVSSSTSVSNAVGQVGRVLIPMGKSQTGKVRIQLKGKTIDLLAKTDGAAIGEGAQVLVVEVKGAEAYVEAIEEAETGRRAQ